MNARLYAACVLAGLLCGLAGRASAAPNADERAQSDRYRVLVDRNIFARDRGRSWPPASTGGTYRPQFASQGRYVLTGVALHDDMAVAFVEDTTARTTGRYRVGDSLAAGKVRSILIDAIEYETNGAVVQVKLGATLAGGEATALPAASTPAQASPAAATSSSAGTAAGLEGEAAILERLRQRRLKETKP